MIDLNKTYKTGDGRKVRLSFVEGEYVHGYIDNTGSELSMRSNWMPYLWVVDCGLPGYMESGQENSQWVDEFKLVESVPVKQVSATVWVDHNGSCFMCEFDDYFASFTVNVEVEKHKHKVITEN